VFSVRGHWIGQQNELQSNVYKISELCCAGSRGKTACFLYQGLRLLAKKVVSLLA
jgi:hypothetical protein